MLFFLLPAILILVLIWRHFVYTAPLSVEGLELKKIVLPNKVRSLTVSFGANLGNSIIFIITLCVWEGGFIFCYIIELFQDLSLLWNLISMSQQCVDPDICNLCKEISDNYQIKNSVSIYQSEFIISPFIIGILRPMIFLPDKSFDPEVLELILAHELWHYKSHDILYKSLITFISGIHWFNPIIYSFSKRFSDCGELACDEAVLERYPKEKRLQYVKIIVRMVNSIQQDSALGSMSDKQIDFTKKRICYIMRGNTYTKKRVILLLITISIFSCPASVFAAISITAYAQEKVINQLLINHSTEVTQPAIGTSTEYPEAYTSAVSYKIYSMIPQGANPVDLIIPGNGRATYNTIALTKGATVKFVVGADGSSKCFRCGIIKGIKSTYVSSLNGAINHTFHIQEMGDYALFFEGKDSVDIHLLGKITITK